MTKKEKIKILYYEEKLNTIEISNKLDISKQYVSKIVRNDTRYSLEREKRKKESFIKQKNRNIDLITKKRKLVKSEQIDDFVRVQHVRDSCELSGRRTINNRVFRNWNSSIYQFHYKTKEYRIKEEIKDKASYAIPKKIKWD